MSLAEPNAPPPPVVICPECTSKLTFKSLEAGDVGPCGKCGAVLVFEHPKPPRMNDATMQSLTGSEKQLLRRQQLRGIEARKASKEQTRRFGELFEQLQKRRGHR